MSGTVTSGLLRVTRIRQVIKTNSVTLLGMVYSMYLSRCEYILFHRYLNFKKVTDPQKTIRINKITATSRSLIF